MTRALCAIIISGFLASGCNPYMKFRNGNFEYVDGETKGTLISRKGNTQYEYMGDSIATKWYVEWQAKDKYILLNDYFLYNETSMPFPKDTIYVDIIEILSDSTYRYRSNMNGNIVSHILWKKSQ
jgi:hypothetical protein